MLAVWYSHLDLFKFDIIMPCMIPKELATMFCKSIAIVALHSILYLLYYKWNIQKNHMNYLV